MTRFLLLLLLLSIPAHAQVKTACYISRYGQQPAAWHDVQAKMDLVVWSNPAPRYVDDLHRRNPNVRVLVEIQPQWVYDGPPPNLADTTWSITRRWQWACYRNDWYLYDETGHKLYNPPGVLVNWTPYCPKGTHGDAVGLRSYEYFPKMVRDIAFYSEWQPWSWDVIGTNCQGLCLEVLTDCMASFVPIDLLRHADPNRDGRAEGSVCACSEGANRDFFTALTRCANTRMWQLCYQMLPRSFVMITNDNRQSLHGPTFLQQFNGRKLENWMRYGRTWWDWYLGFDGVGYLLAESRMHRSGIDARDGWDASIIRWVDNDGPHLRRLAVATALLGDGYVFIDVSGPDYQYRPVWWPEYDEFNTLGQAQGEAHAVARQGGLVMERRFERGTVTVNPKTLEVKVE
jgi:hypothetical protein